MAPCLCGFLHAFDNLLADEPMGDDHVGIHRPDDILPSFFQNEYHPINKPGSRKE